MVRDFSTGLAARSAYSRGLGVRRTRGGAKTPETWIFSWDLEWNHESHSPFSLNFWTCGVQLCHRTLRISGEWPLGSGCWSHPPKVYPNIQYSLETMGSMGWYWIMICSFWGPYFWGKDSSGDPSHGTSEGFHHLDAQRDIMGGWSIPSFHCSPRQFHVKRYFQWIGLRENLQETIDFPMKYGAYTSNFSLKPIHWYLIFSSSCNA